MILSKEEKVKANAACAELLGRFRYLGVTSCNYSKVDIFTNAEQCLAVVVILTSLRMVITIVESESLYYTWLNALTGKRGEPVGEFKEAVAAAAIDVIGS